MTHDKGLTADWDIAFDEHGPAAPAMAEDAYAPLRPVTRSPPSEKQPFHDEAGRRPDPRNAGFGPYHDTDWTPSGPTDLRPGAINRVLSTDDIAMLSAGACLTVPGVDTGAQRGFASGAIRDTEQGKLDYEGFLSPAVLEAFARYMDFHRDMPSGERRDSDNWQKGFPPAVLVKSLWRHFFSLWRWHRSKTRDECCRGLQNPLEDACGILFNTMAYMQSMLVEDPLAADEMLRVMGHKRDATRRAG